MSLLIVTHNIPQEPEEGFGPEAKNPKSKVKEKKKKSKKRVKGLTLVEPEDASNSTELF